MAPSHIESLSEISETYFWWKGRLDWVVDHLKNLQKAKGKKFSHYIDVGCGSGQFARKLDSIFNFEKVGLIDGESSLLSKVKQFSKAEVFLQNLTTSLEFPFAPQLITMMDVLEHLPDDSDFLNKLYEKMPTHSNLVITVPALPYAFSEWDKQLGHFRRYYRKDLKNKVEAAGFRVLKAEYAWSFLVPSAVARRFKTKKFQQNMEFVAIPKGINFLLSQASRIERHFASLLPFGTSVYLIGEKT